jgi:adenosylmethionine-8-amino-7-oxononanoate aminotransferase
MALMHGPTFMGNPLACSAANASLDLFEKENYQQKVEEISNCLKQNLLPLKNKYIQDIRVLGAIGVIETNLPIEKIFQLRQEFIQHGVCLRPFANVIYIMPSLSIAKKELLFILKKVSEVINAFI